MLKLKTIMTTTLLALLVLPLAAQERTDTVYTFRFMPGRDMFYVPWGGNDRELTRLETCVTQWKTQILAGTIPVQVDGYCTSGDSETDNLAIAKIRANRVKSELITRQGLREACFVTHNHATEGDFVTVRIAVPKKDTATPETENRLTEQQQEQVRKEAEQQRADKNGLPASARRRSKSVNAPKQNALPQHRQHNHNNPQKPLPRLHRKPPDGMSVCKAACLSA